MVGDILQPTHLLFVLVVALLVLGPKRLPEVAKTLGNGIRDFRTAISGEREDDDDPVPRLATHHEPEPSDTPEAEAATAEPESSPSAHVEPKPAASEPAEPPASASEHPKPEPDASERSDPEPTPERLG